MRRFILLLAAFLSVGCDAPTHFNATDLTGGSIGVDFALQDQNGKQRRLSDFKGKVAIVFFGYTQCPDVCPTTLSSLQETLKLLGPEADRLQVLFITLDPERDTAALLAQYVSSFHPSFLGLRGGAAETEATAQAFKVFYKKQAGTTPGSYSIDHSTGSYVYDPQGRLRLYLKYGETPQRIAEDVKKLLAGK
ncbi:photosynthetic protein synthase I [Rugosibacter aromaticivorans]|uniref:Photosynthetic protein synthase I n=1 Tax=Rugosibacter aromaticivorans TaxID=1565605 RepID=A0A0C5J793_9PROT|nr:SCO family protein [Rugosibacter aromaticivorans]AJP47514.1 photosynthetic protein synthase I [Rugosibacter aromaticivorans]TBR13005.1 MAG: SCO family protein [Rugosibacter sp.]